MSCFSLTTPREAIDLISRLYSLEADYVVEVREEKAFKNDGWLNLGVIKLDRGGGSKEAVQAAVARGGFEWELPALSDVQKSIGGLLGVQQSQMMAKVRRALDGTAAITLRAGLQYPKFDPHALESMPFRRSTTIVADTSGVVQGGLDFVVRYLHPAARVKVPAIVQMELVNFAERFLSGRRATKTRHADLLIDHLMSQGGQRVLLRLELQDDTEIERTYLLGDPLRSAFQKEDEPELRELNLSVSIRAYVDRLVVEAARQHQAQSNPGHRVQLLTSDQGLARMALAEGVTPLFFGSVVAEDAFGKRLTGTVLDPFHGTLREIPLASVLWELATAFGSARLRNIDGAHLLTIAAIGEAMSWSPYQSHADLLWCDHEKVPSWRPNVLPPPASLQSATGSLPAEESRATAQRAEQHSAKSASSTAVRIVGVQRFNVSLLFNLIDKLDNQQVLTQQDVIRTVNARNREGNEEYRRFLISGSFVELHGTDWHITDAGQRLAIALRNEAIEDVKRLLLEVPSFSLFARRLAELSIGTTWDPAEFKRAATTYRTLGEVCHLCAPIAGEGIFPTLTRPDPEQFAQIAVARFRDLDRGDGWVATGEWLEALIRKDGIHPEVARIRLSDASSSNLLRRSTEGSTTEVRFDDHVIQVLRTLSGRPAVVSVHIYRGDYLIPGKSSSSLRIEGPST